MTEFKKSKGIKLKSGNSSSFKTMGSSPMEQIVDPDKKAARKENRKQRRKDREKARQENPPTPVREIPQKILTTFKEDVKRLPKSLTNEAKAYVELARDIGTATKEGVQTGVKNIKKKIQDKKKGKDTSSPAKKTGVKDNY